LAPEFAQGGVNILAVSSDEESGGTETAQKVQAMPFARLQLQDLPAAIDFAISKDYPARGEYTGEV
jgi:hypothetical protein